MPTFGGEPTEAQVAPPQVLPVGTATLNGTVSYYVKRYLLLMFCDVFCVPWSKQIYVEV